MEVTRFLGPCIVHRMSYYFGTRRKLIVVIIEIVDDLNGRSHVILILIVLS